MILKAGRSKIYRVGWQTGEGEKLMLQFQPEGRPQAEPHLLWEISVFFLLRSSTDWMRPTHVKKGNVLYSRVIDLNVKLNCKTPL